MPQKFEGLHEASHRYGGATAAPCRGMLRFAVLPLLATGCLDERNTCGDGDLHQDGLVEECDDGNGVAGDGCSPSCLIEAEVNLEWQLFETVGAPATRCRDGVTTVDLVLPDVEGDRVISSSCNAGSVHAFKQWFGQSVYAQLRDANGNVVATSLRSAATFAVAKFYATAGYLHTSWQFRNAAGVPVDCEQATTQPIVVDMTPASGPTITNTFDCIRRDAYSDPLPAGTYDVKVHTEAGDVTQNVVISPNNAVTELPLVFTI